MSVWGLKWVDKKDVRYCNQTLKKKASKVSLAKFVPGRQLIKHVLQKSWYTRNQKPTNEWDFIQYHKFVFQPSQTTPVTISVHRTVTIQLRTELKSGWWQRKAYNVLPLFWAESMIFILSFFDLHVYCERTVHIRIICKSQLLGSRMLKSAMTGLVVATYDILLLN